MSSCSVPSLEDVEEKRRQFPEFVRGILRWVPGERAMAKDLLENPWLARINRGIRFVLK